MQVSWKQSYSTRSQSPRCTFAISIATAKLQAWSRHVHGITQYKMASNIQLTTGRGRHFNNVFEQSWCHCRVGATPASRSNCLQTRRIHYQVKYRRLNANTCIVAAILFSGHPYIGSHYRASLINTSECYTAATELAL